jgi:hypothetical protein
MMLRSRALLAALAHVTPVKNYIAESRERKELALRKKQQEQLKHCPLRYQIIGCVPGCPLAIAKVKFLIACRANHPEVGGDPETFLRICLAYQDVLKDYGIETIRGQVVNLGNFQSCPTVAQHYLETRAAIKEHIPISTLNDHIERITAIEARLGHSWIEKLSSRTDETMWLLEEIESAIEKTGLGTIRLTLLSDGTVAVASNVQIGDGKLAENKMIGDGHRLPEAEPIRKENCSILSQVEVSQSELDCLNAKYNVAKRSDVAGIGARVATALMNHTKERQAIVTLGFIFLFIWACIMLFVWAVLYGWSLANHTFNKNPDVKEHIRGDTMLPWWGNDGEYESQVKRMFVEEWRKARSSARRIQTFQEGVAHESLDNETKHLSDVLIFEVNSDKLRKLKENAESKLGRQ